MIKSLYQDSVAVFLGTWIAVFLLFVSVVITIVTQIEVRTYAAKIEVVREASTQLQYNNSEDAIGEIIQMNEFIAEYRRYNQMPIIQWFTPNAWDRIEFIQIPQY